jgi:hypothetical protein
VKSRKHHPSHLCKIHDIIAKAGPQPACWQKAPTLIESNKNLTAEFEGIAQNFPDLSYTVNTDDPQQILELLVYTAHDWAARETLKFHHRNHSTGKEREIRNSFG